MMGTYSVFWLDEGIVDGNDVDLVMLDALARESVELGKQCRPIKPNSRVAEDLEIMVSSCVKTPRGRDSQYGQFDRSR